MLHSFRNSGSPFSLVIGTLCIKHSNIFGKCEKLDILWDKGLYDSNVLVAYKKPRPEWLGQQSVIIQHSISPEIGIHGFPVENFSRSDSRGVNLCRLAVGLDLSEPKSSNWSSKTSLKFEVSVLSNSPGTTPSSSYIFSIQLFAYLLLLVEWKNLLLFVKQHVCPVSDEGRSISRDLHGLPVTCSGGSHDSRVVLKQESRFAKVNDRSFTRFSLQIEQGIPLLTKWLVFNRFKFVASKWIRLGPAFLLTSLTGGSVVGDIAPYQAFAIGGLGSVRGYGEGAVGSGRSCLVANSELTLPL
ncbi:unnamed protein product, partial [Ilex paraguariensis]